MDQQERLRSYPASLDAPQISLLGDVNEDMVRDFFAGLKDAEKAGGDIAMEITTPGGDAELGRRLVLEVEIARRRLGGRRFLFLGKTQVYSAGVTLMSAFPVADRYLSRDTILMIHGRQLDKTVELSGPMRASKPEVEALLSQIECGLRHEEENLKRLIEGSKISFEEARPKALHNWYVPADEALRLGLVAGVI